MNPAGSILFRLHLTFWGPNKFIKWRARRRSRARHSTVNEKIWSKKLHMHHTMDNGLTVTFLFTPMPHDVRCSFAFTQIFVICLVGALPRVRCSFKTPYIDEMTTFETTDFNRVFQEKSLKLVFWQFIENAHRNKYESLLFRYMLFFPSSSVLQFDGLNWKNFLLKSWWHYN